MKSTETLIRDDELHKKLMELEKDREKRPVMQMELLSAQAISNIQIHLFAEISRNMRQKAE